MNLPEINFGTLIYNEYEGGGACVASVGGVRECDYLSYLKEVEKAEYSLVNSYNLEHNSFSVFRKGNDAIYAAFYPMTGEMRVVTEPDSAYLDFDSQNADGMVQSLITQIHLEDFGMSYVIRLADSRFVILDCGREFEPDSDRLMECLREQSESEKPVIAAWIMTHPHLDHYRCYFEFEKKYSDSVVIEKFIYNFPDTGADDIAKIPALENADEHFHLNRFYESVKKTGAPVFRAHTGQIYEFSNAKLEILSSPDDTFYTPVKSFNEVSLVIKMTIDNQVVLWGGDAVFEVAKLGKRWGTYLKSDILQIPHHGFVGGAIYEYNFIDPKVCMTPVEISNALVMFNIYEDYNRHLIYNLNVSEYILDEGESITLSIPYTPKPNGKQIMFDKVNEYQRSIGAKSWYFEGLTKAECDFVIINSSGKRATIYADLIFDSALNAIRHIKLEAKGLSTNRKNLFNPEDADGDALYFNKRSLAKNPDIADDAVFTVHFRSDVPVVIKGKRNAIYYS